MAAWTGIAAARCSAIRGSFGKRNRVALGSGKRAITEFVAKHDATAKPSSSVACGDNLHR
jgi:hypothetical protein